MKRLIRILIGLLFLAGCSENCGNRDISTFYLFETADYCDFDSISQVIYIKTAKKLREIKCKRDSIPPDVLNAFGHLARDYKIEVPDTSDYDLTLHLHSGDSNTLWITSRDNMADVRLVRYYMLGNGDVFQFLYPLPMTTYLEGTYDSISGYEYKMKLENNTNFDWGEGERVVLEYGTYKIPVPYQIFRN